MGTLESMWRTVSLVLVSSMLPAQSVFVVDDDGGAGVFTDLQEAIDLATAGTRS